MDMHIAQPLETVLRNVSAEYGWGKEYERKLLAYLQSERIFTGSTLYKVELDNLCQKTDCVYIAGLRAVAEALGVSRSVPRLFTIPKDLGKIKTKKWLSAVLRAGGWSERLVKEDRKVLKKLGVKYMKGLELLSPSDWRTIDIAEGLKAVIQDALADGIDMCNLDSKIGTLRIEDNAESLRCVERTTVATKDGMVYEIDRYCPHKGADLSKGDIEDGVLVCPKHKWRFDLADGGNCVEGKRNHSINSTRVRGLED